MLLFYLVDTYLVFSYNVTVCAWLSTVMSPVYEVVRCGLSRKDTEQI